MKINNASDCFSHVKVAFDGRCEKERHLRYRFDWPLCHSGFVATLIDNKEFIINLKFLFLLDIPRNIPSHSHNPIAHLVPYVRLLSTHTTRTVISHSRCALPFRLVKREQSDRSCVMLHLLSSGKRVKGQWIFCYFCKLIRRIFMTAQIVWNYSSRFFFEKNAKCFLFSICFLK